MTLFLGWQFGFLESSRCNGQRDCSDRSNEEHFEVDDSSFIDGSGSSFGDDEDDGSLDSTEHFEVECLTNEFKCHNGEKCIENLKKCDGNKDCSDESDEKYCGFDFNGDDSSFNVDGSGSGFGDDEDDDGSLDSTE